MSILPRAESKRSYSWWWDSHISPKNSKWLQENLKDMDVKVKAMIKLIEEDADSFARRAEMYYKKRPELMKLVEELYRAYRALAERYDHATGALRHAHRTMSEAFPNQIPLALLDESVSNNTPEEPSPRRALFDFDDLPKDTFGPPTAFKAFDRKETYPKDNEALATKKGSRQFDEMIIPRVKLSEENDVVDIDADEEEVVARVRIPERKVRKSLNFQEEEGNTPNAKIYIDSKNQFQQEHKDKENAKSGIEHLQEQVSQLSSENQRLKDMVELGSKHLDLSREEVQNFRNVVSKLESEKVAALLQNQSSGETISNLEIEISKVKDEIGKINEEMEKTLLKLSGAEIQCVELEKANQSLQFELEEAKGELEEVRISLNESKEKHVKTEMALQSSERLYNQSNEKVMLMTLEIQILAEKVKETEHFKVGLEDEIRELKAMNYTLNEHNSECTLKVTHLEAEIISLKEINSKLEEEVEIHTRSKKIIQEELDSLKNDKFEMDLRHESLTKQMEELRFSLIESKEKQVKTEIALQSSEQLYNQANDKVILMTLEIQILAEKLKEIELFKVGLEDELRELVDMNHTLSEHYSECALKTTHLEGEIISLKEIIGKLEGDVEIHLEKKKVLQQELNYLKDDKNEIDLKHQSLAKEMEEASLHSVFLDTLVKKLQSGHDELEECCGKLEVEKVVFLGKLKDMVSVSDRNSALEKSLFEANVELQELRERIKFLEGSSESINAAISTHIGEKKVLQLELDYLKDDKNEIDLKHQSLIKEMEEASLRSVFLDTLVKKLQSGHDELEEYCGKLEVEKVVFLDKLKDMVSVSDRNSALEKSLFEANVELEELRERIKFLEGSCESINAAISTHTGEKTALASEVEILTENLGRLSMESTLLESSLDAANTELVELRLKLRALEELLESLRHENLDIVAQKNDLLSQVERLEQTLGNLEATHANLEEKKLNLVNEKGLPANKILKLENSLSVLQKEHEKQPLLVQENRQISEELEATHQQCFSHMAENIILQSCLYDMSDSWIVEKQKYMSLVQSKEIQLSDLESQIQVLQEEIKVRDSKMEEEEQKSMNSMLEIFILNECLSEMKGENFSVVLECRKLQEASRSVNVLIKELEGRDLVQKQNIGILMEKLFDIENENGRLRINLKALSPLFSSAGNGISDVEEHVHQLAKLHGNSENKPSYQQKNHETNLSDHDHSTMPGVLEMHNLIAKIQSLQKLIVDTNTHLDYEKLQFAANLENARREVEELKLKESSTREEKQGMESSPNMVKDIELDQVSNSCGVSRIQSVESNDQTLKLWETPDGELENRISTEQDMGAEEEVKGEKPLSDLVAEKDIRVHKHETSREIKESQDEWNRMVIKRLGANSNKLLALQNSAHQLKLKMERSVMSRGQNKLQFDTLWAKLKDAEAAIFDLLDRNAKTTLMAEIYTNSCGGEGMGSAEREEVFQQVRNASKRIEMVELELEKINYIFLKLEDEYESYVTRGGDQTPRLLLRDYLYGRRHEKGKKRSRFCLFARPRTLD